MDGNIGLQSFNPRSPHGERLRQSATHNAKLHVSIHAPHTGSDNQPGLTGNFWVCFNPRSPHGERLASFERNR